MTPVQLPEVPAPVDRVWADVRGQMSLVEPGDTYYTADQLRAYATEYGAALLDEFLRMACEPVGLECCGHGRGECCGEPEPVFASPGEVFQAMSERLAALTETTTQPEQNSGR